MCDQYVSVAPLDLCILRLIDVKSKNRITLYEVEVPDMPSKMDDMCNVVTRSDYHILIPRFNLSYA